MSLSLSNDVSNCNYYALARVAVIDLSFDPKSILPITSRFIKTRIVKDGRTETAACLREEKHDRRQTARTRGGAVVKLSAPYLVLPPPVGGERARKGASWGGREKERKQMLKQSGFSTTLPPPNWQE